MARIVNRTLQNIDGEIRGLGFSFPMSANGVFTSTYTTRDVVKNNLINWLLTNKGERVFRPLFGANLRELIFEEINSVTASDKYIPPHAWAKSSLTAPLFLPTPFSSRPDKRIFLEAARLLGVPIPISKSVGRITFSWCICSKDCSSKI